MSLELWLTFVAASTALLLIPGPTVLLVLSYALSKGRSVAVASATGVAVGDLGGDDRVAFGARCAGFSLGDAVHSAEMGGRGLFGLVGHQVTAQRTFDRVADGLDRA